MKSTKVTKHYLIFLQACYIKPAQEIRAVLHIENEIRLHISLDLTLNKICSLDRIYLSAPRILYIGYHFHLERFVVKDEMCEIYTGRMSSTPTGKCLQTCVNCVYRNRICYSTDISI